ncbi:hybrid sensor histidine kinase/response regulator [Pusillimonas minor]|uniref:histidine kinase n=1 Tax=Pusillimonas minor TaxID=2697024 RepID=A0A842HLT6_9BURK|nr:PAS domain-containing protein [Pusillimonas minor]MBC2769223.1 PAS domain-containing protein [Pusillimonas minor]
MPEEIGFFFENHPDPMLVYEPDSLRILAANRAASEVYGYTHEEFLNMTIAAIRPPEDVPRLLAMVKQVAGQRGTGNMWRHRTKAGKIIYADVLSQPLVYHGTQARLVVIRNVTANTHLQTFVEALPGKFMVIDANDLSIVSASDEYLAATMRKREEIKGRHLFEAFPADPNDTDLDGVTALQRSLTRVVESRHTDSMAVQRYPIPRPPELGGGFEERFWSTVNSPIFGYEGNVAYIVHRVEDVTEFVRLAESHNDGDMGAANAHLIESHNKQLATDILVRSRELKETNARLSEYEANLRMAQRLLGLGIWRLNIDTNEIVWSDNIYTMFGQTPAGFGHSVEAYTALIHPGDRSAFEAYVAEYMRNPLPMFELNHRIVRPDGKIIYIRGVAELTITPDGRLLNGVVQDITADVQARQQSLMLAQRLAQTLDSMSDAFYLLDKQWCFSYINAEGERLLRRNYDDLIGRNLWAAFPEAAESIIKTEYEKAIADDTAVEFSLYFAPLNTWFEINAYPSSEGLAVYFRDVTERREMAERLNQSQKMEAIGQLTGGIAHDFNNLLTVILGNAELLKESLDDQPSLRLFAEMSASAAERGAELTNRLLAFARRQALEPKVIDTNKLVSGIEGLLRRALNEDIDIELVRGGGVWPAEVDPSQLESAILNMAINARDAMPGGGKLTIETANARLDDAYAESHPDVKPGQYVMISVSDTGTGMPAEVIAKAFEPFYTTKPAGKGSGLGLSMVYGFVKQSGGHIKIYSEIGEGTTIRLYFPRANPTGIDDAFEPARAVVPGHEHILVVEDDDLVRTHVVTQLKGLGYRVTEAASGQVALDLIKRHNDIDLLFTDVVMPGGMNGRQLADQAMALRPQLKVLYTSGYTENAIVHHGRLDQGVHLLAKPYRRSDLAAKLRKALG